MPNKKANETIDRAGRDSFPASDPPSASGIVGPGVPSEKARPATDEREEHAERKGRPDHDRHRQTAYRWEHEKSPARD